MGRCALKRARFSELDDLITFRHYPIFFIKARFELPIFFVCHNSITGSHETTWSRASCKLQVPDALPAQLYTQERLGLHIGVKRADSVGLAVG